MDIMEQQYSPSIFRAQKGLELSVLGADILAAIGRYQKPAPLTALGLRIEGVSPDSVTPGCLRLFVHGRTVETRSDHVWNQATKKLMGRIRFLLLEDDGSLGAQLFVLHFDDLGNVNGNLSFAKDEDEKNATIRHVILSVVNAIHEVLPSVTI